MQDDLLRSLFHRLENLLIVSGGSRKILQNHDTSSTLVLPKNRPSLERCPPGLQARARVSLTAAHSLSQHPPTRSRAGWGCSQNPRAGALSKQQDLEESTIRPHTLTSFSSWASAMVKLIGATVREGKRPTRSRTSR